MRYIVTALLMAAGLVLLVIDAMADDGYYGDGTSRWDHAVRAGTAPFAVGAAVVAGAATLWVLSRFRAVEAPSVLLLVAAVIVYSFSLLMAHTFLAMGH